LSWVNKSTTCADDVIQFKIYRKDSLTGDYNLVTSIGNGTDTTFLHDKLFSIAGCYAITGIDSVGNESLFSDSVCVDNCPRYDLPNVFTPGNDGWNDVFGPFPYKFVESVSIKIYNRWGQLMYETNDPDVNWTGLNSSNNAMCSDGTYFYVCIVNEIHLEGIKPRILKGFVQLLRNHGEAGF